MGVRRKARESALKLLYQIDLAGDGSREARAAFWDADGDSGEDTREFTEQLVDQVIGREDRLDGVIDAALDRWQLDRLARIDLLLLRLSVCELLDGKTPAAIVIDEAIEIARRYSDPDAPKFINGVLDRVAREHGLVEK